MKPLQSMQNALTWFCVYPVLDANAKWKKWASVVFSLVCVGTITFQVWASVAFVRMSDNFKDALDSFRVVLGWTPLVIEFIIVIVIKNDIVALFDGLSVIYETNAEKEISRYLVQINNRCEWIWDKYVKYGIFGFFCISFVSWLGPLIRLFISKEEFNTENLFLQFQIVLPWDQSTPLGYLGESLYAFFACTMYLTFHGAILILFISSCLHYKSFYKMLNHSMSNLESPKKNGSDMKSLCEIIDFHCSVRSWFIASVKVFRSLVMVTFLFYMLTVAALTYHLDLEIKHPSSHFGSTLSSLIVAIIHLYAYCHFGKPATDSFENMADSVYESNWMRFPSHLQKHFILMIRNSRRPIEYKGYFAVFTVNLETFAKLMKTVFTYYMVLKTFFD